MRRSKRGSSAVPCYPAAVDRAFDRGTRFAGSLVAVWVVALAVSRSAFGFECTAAGDRCYVNVTWSDRTVPYTVRLPSDSALPAAQLQGAADRAFERITNVSCSDLRFVFAGVVRSDEVPEGVNEVTPVPSGWVDGGRAPTAAALTTVTFGAESARIVQMRIEVNEEFHGFVDVQTEACATSFDLEAVLTHEAGHAAGLAHPCEFPGAVNLMCPAPNCNQVLASLPLDEPLPTMWPVIPPCDSALRTLEADDIAGLCTLYPRDEVGRACYPLPNQDEPYVANEPFAFGCRAGPAAPMDGRSTFPWPALGMLAVGLTAFLRDGGRAPNRCGGPSGSRENERDDESRCPD